MRYLVLVYLLAFTSCNTINSISKRNKAIDVWYGKSQRFGKMGVAQQWVNVLGNIEAEAGIAYASYTLNGGAQVVLSIGNDLHRLANEGDFNVDINRIILREGKNDLNILVRDSSDNYFNKRVKIHYSNSKTWPIPYTIEWEKVNRIQDVVQVVDGHWEITKDGLHNIDTYYDRVVAFGDSSWQNYEVHTSVTFHSFTPPSKRAPTYGVSHAAIASRWPGHDIDTIQPHVKWYPLGATSEFRLTGGLDSCRWRIFDGPKSNSEDFYVEQSVEKYRKIELNKKYFFKHRVESIDVTTTKYSVKLWPSNEIEPGEWDIIGIEQNENLPSGAALLIAHHTNVTFGNVYVRGIE